MKSIDRESISQLLLIIGGFILAETIVRYFLTLSKEVLPLWVLPLISVLIIFEAISFKKEGLSSGFIYIIYLSFCIVLVVLFQKGIVSSINFAIIFFGISIISVITFIIQYFKPRWNSR